jgi:hypothetical protein
MKKVSMCCVVIVMAALSGCFDKELTPEEKALVSTLRSELIQTNQELALANTTAASYGGLIKSLAVARVEILKTNGALLEQRIQAIESGAKLKVEVPATQPNEVLAASLSNEIATAKTAIALEKVDAAQYGGLIQAIRLSTVATKEQTLAMLEQRYLSAKYGLALASVPQTAVVTPESNPAQSASVTEAAPPAAESQTLSIPPADGPLGLAAGLNKDEIEAMSGQKLTLLNEKQNLYGLTNAPKPNDSFERLALVVSPTIGLCQIRAIGKTITSNSFGNQLQSSFAEMQNALTEVYGKPSSLNTLMSGSIWDEPKEWMMSLYKKERYLSAEWRSTPGKPLRNNIDNIGMEARATGTSDGYYMLQYTFNNSAACDAEEKAKARSSL